MTANEKRNVELAGYGRKEVARTYFRTILILAILLISAGTIKWVNAWVYTAVNALLAYGYGRTMSRLNPGMLNARGKPPKGAKRFDKVIMALLAPALFLSFVIAGFDAVRYGWTVMPLWLSALGLLFYIGGVLFFVWAMAVNDFFEKTVRIQHDRNHRVCTKGPYRFVRHPGYCGIIVSNLAGSLVLGSWWALVPSTAAAILFVIRTALEDQTLQSELAGYMDYAQKTPYRLVPKVW